MDDLEKGSTPLEEFALSVEQAWDQKYIMLPAFAMVPWSQFRQQLKAHQKKIKKKKVSALKDEHLFQLDELRFPKNPSNRRGELIFDQSPAHALLMQDVKDKKTRNKNSIRIQNNPHSVLSL